MYTSYFPVSFSLILSPYYLVKSTDDLIMHFSPSYCYFLLGPSILFITLFSDTLSLSHNGRDQVSQPYESTDYTAVLCTFCFNLYVFRWEAWRHSDL